jgi:hypothetical protein
VACYDKIRVYKHDPAPAPWDRSTPHSIHLECGNISLCSQFLMFQSHSILLKCRKPITHISNRTHNHKSMKTLRLIQLLNLQNQHSFHIILCMSYSIWPMGMAAHNHTQLHHIILETIYLKIICHITQFMMYASAYK